MFSINKWMRCAGLVVLMFSTHSYAQYVEPSDIDLLDPPLNSVQITYWYDYPVLVHRRTPEQIQWLSTMAHPHPEFAQRKLGYRSIARHRGNEFASVIMEFTENLINTRGQFMSEIPEFGIYSMTSPVLGCAVTLTEDGFLDPCSSVKFDFNGQAYDSHGYNHLRLTIPPHKITDNKLTFLYDYQPQSVYDFTPDILNLNVTDIDKALLAIDFERPDLLQAIVSANRQVLTQTNSHGTNLVQSAAVHDTTLDYVLTFSEVEINHINHSGFTAIQFALLVGKTDNAKTLFKHGARVDAFSVGGRQVRSIRAFLASDDMHHQSKIAAEFLTWLECQSGQ